MGKVSFSGKKSDGPPKLAVLETKAKRYGQIQEQINTLEKEKDVLKAEMKPLVKDLGVPTKKGGSKLTIGGWIPERRAKVEVFLKEGAEKKLEEEGILDLVTTRKLDKKKLEAAHKEGLIDDDLLLAVVDEKVTYSFYCTKVKDSES